MYQELLERYGRSNWRVAVDPLNQAGYALYDDQDCIRGVIGQDDGVAWSVQVIFLERVKSYGFLATSAAALERALWLLREEERNVP